MNLSEKKNYGWMLVISYSLMGIFFPAAVTQFSMSVKEIALEMQQPEQMVLLSDTIRAIFLVTGMFLTNSVSKKIGLKKTMILGMTCQISSQFLIPIAVSLKSLPFLFIFKGLQGLNSVAFPLYISTIAMWINPEQRGLSTAVFNGSFTAGAGIGAWLTGKIISVLGWKACFIVVGGLTLLFAIPAAIITKEREGYVNLKKEKSSSFFLIKDSAMLMLVIGLLAYTWVSQAITVDMSIYSKYIGYSYSQTGNLMLTISLATIFFSISGGFISDYFAKRSKNKLKARTRVLAIGYLVSIISSLLLPRIANINFIGIVIPAVMMMAGVGWVQGVFWSIPPEMFGKKYLVTATALCSGISNIVNPIAPVVVGVVLGMNDMWTMAWTTCSIMSVISLISICILPRMNTRKYIN